MENNIIDISEIKFEINQFFALVAKRYYGKSCMCLQLLLGLVRNHKISRIVIFSDTAKLTGFYNNFCKKTDIFTSEDIDTVLSKIMKHQEEKDKKNRKNVIIILDDIPTTKISKQLQKIASMGRHFCITCILSTQYPKTFMTPAIRGNCDVFFVGQLSREAFREITSSFVTVHEDFNSLYAEYRKMEAPVFLVYNSREKSRNKRLFFATCQLIDERTKICSS